MILWYKLKIILYFKIQCYEYLLIVARLNKKKSIFKKKIFKQNGLSVSICL